jgi:uncharacterized RDD family membrane protein YckC
MRVILAALVDVAAASAVAFVGFQLAYLLTPCGNVANCFPLTPVAVLTILVLVGLYFAVSIKALGATLGKRLLGIKGAPET